MKRIFITFVILAATLLMSGCASKNNADLAPSPTTSPDVVTQTQVPTTTTSTTSAEPPAGHLWKTEYKGLLIQINSAETTKDVFDHEFLVFDLTLQNGTDNPLEVSGRAFNLLTVNKELLESDPTAETVESGDIQTSTVLPGGQRTLRVGFVVQPVQVSELIFNVGQNAVYRITSFDDSSSSPAEATATITPAEEPSSAENTPIIEGSNAKSDDFIFEDNYLGYLNSLIEAINTGDFSLVEIHLLYDSELYSQQQKLVQTLSEKGTREELVDYEIQSAAFDEESGTLTMKVKEQIKIISADGTEKTADNVWTYNALQVDQGVFQFSTIAKAE
ncbi:hypothetical protein SAMN04487895_11479 [Paenibacillus sophorae]|uniref:TcaA protein NTF2-like domain-containing protein n=1 Tax=Paenibacillus sophorae TaxID=1333845 RepID=A0A1H8TJ49_9BACL|nr:hypothetical protein [Paenibacillus sophorae]QWU16237.1 hypothetical protein KP014_02900 [Paenibacillus sophorae]SEO90865.1 hypothetical protein SAMN04487895_11479 [Paenibacillus sophorae]